MEERRDEAVEGRRSGKTDKRKDGGIKWSKEEKQEGRNCGEMEK